MPYSLTWLPDVLRGAGLKVAEVDGWRERGRGEMGRVLESYFEARVVDAQDEDMPDGVPAVSYTHLTLPTKRIV